MAKEAAQPFWQVISIPLHLSRSVKEILLNCTRALKKRKYGICCDIYCVYLIKDSFIFTFLLLPDRQLSFLARLATMFVFLIVFLFLNQVFTYLKTAQTPTPTNVDDCSCD